ncbi:uncharacterized protein LOC129773656 [Toxorhynchites rutilus septentrionalis]|uniref:uncharacterized protein LOC129773656 n=1 Tax=Toxorhynchites rutilus septentrionalis TaxID=329112 RepID=UPI00247873CB|nr:uncharacterized protein LOC129773656 [Toxorhynchites rutilus septentrionalis]
MDSFRPIKQFDTKVDQSQLATEWRKWKRSLEYYLAASGITGQREKRDQLLHLGVVLQDIFDNLPGVHDVPHVTPDPPFYDVAVQHLDSHFQPCQRRTYERHVFRQISQQPGERFGDFVMKLRVQAGRCDFDQEGSSVMESMIIDQIAEKCLSSALRKKILEKDRSLSEVVAIGKTLEDVEQQCKELAQKEVEVRTTSTVNKVNQKPPQHWRASYQPTERRLSNFRFNSQGQFRRTNPYEQPRYRLEGNGDYSYSRIQPTSRSAGNYQQNTDDRICFACGRRGHRKGSAVCVAREAQCRKCRVVGHFAKWCTKRVNEDPPQDSVLAKRIKTVNEASGLQNNYRNVDESDKEQQICFVMGENVFRFKVGGVETIMTIDSGAVANIIDVRTWEMLQRHEAKLRFSSRVDRKFKAYGSTTPLTMIGKFVAEIEAVDNKVEATFYIAENGMQNLLGDETAKKLKVLKIGYNVGSLQETSTSFPKIKGVLVEIPVDPNVKPIQQAYRRAPFALEEKVAAKLQYLLDQDIIERVHHPSAWVSPIVPVLKDNGEVRLCVDMRRANQAVLRETHPLPIVEELFGSIKGATRFSKLDIREAYHQVEISERSRDITTFITKQGLYRYK